jgi:hypothetical protein
MNMECTIEVIIQVGKSPLIPIIIEEFRREKREKSMKKRAIKKATSSIESLFIS